ncbi:MAG TPA: L-histidine N(alpha)-methyltransferase [Acidobacteriaceae bacterium]|nr:L-histidine N(alpha)-methyltransferase [Acidobacteriaceae bacterium]
MTAPATAFDFAALSDPSIHAVDVEARRGLTLPQKSLAPWLFYDEAGSELFEQITELPEYYLTRTERALFTAHATQIFAELGLSAKSSAPESAPNSRPRSAPQVPNAPPYENAVSDPRPATIPFTRPLTVVELGAGTASKTGILLQALSKLQHHVLYQPVDISASAIAAARASLESTVSGLSIRPHTANYVTHRFPIVRSGGARVLALYIGSSIGNFSPSGAREILTRLRAQLTQGDALLLGVDLAPSLAGADPPKQISTLLAAYDDAAGVTAAFNRNVLVRLNRDLGANFEPDRFAHRALWNPARSRIEMHLVSLDKQTAILPRSAAGPAVPLHFNKGETIHTENSYKFTPAALAALFAASRFRPKRTFTDLNNLFSVTLACAD